MTHLSELARAQPGAPAATAADGTGLTFAQLDDESRRRASLLAGRGLQPGDTVAILLENVPRYLAAAWGVLRAGLVLVPVNWHLSAAEAVYIARDSGARAVITSGTLASPARELAAASPVLETRLATGGPVDGFEDLDAAAALAASSPERPAGEVSGQVMFYSSGTTGRPKGIRHNAPPAAFGSEQVVESLLAGLYGFSTETIYLCTGPLDHAAPLGRSLGRLVRVVVVGERRRSLDPDLADLAGRDRPAVVEEALAMHPAVADVAVIGLPHAEMGEEIRAVVQPAAGVTGSPELSKS
jgi:long-chain acyl-CoA synthetase